MCVVKKLAKPKMKNNAFLFSNNRNISPNHEKTKPVNNKLLRGTVVVDIFNNNINAGINKGLAIKCTREIPAAIPIISAATTTPKNIAHCICTLSFIKHSHRLYLISI